MRGSLVAGASTKNVMNNIELDRYYLDLALALAAQGQGKVFPNPMVGAVVVKDGSVVGRGFHRYDHIKHAEVLALEQAGNLTKGGTLYVSLEPCCHRGGGKRNPPCVDAIIAAQVDRVVCCTTDPNPRVDGGGIAALRQAGIKVSVGLRSEAARKLNEDYIKYITGPPVLNLTQIYADTRSRDSFRTPPDRHR